MICQFSDVDDSLAFEWKNSGERCVKTYREQTRFPYGTHDSHDFSILFPSTLHMFSFALLRERETRHSFPAARFLSATGPIYRLLVFPRKRKLRGNIWSINATVSLFDATCTLYLLSKRASFFYLYVVGTRARIL